MTTVRRALRAATRVDRTRVVLAGAAVAGVALLVWGLRNSVDAIFTGGTVAGVSFLLLAGS